MKRLLSLLIIPLLLAGAISLSLPQPRASAAQSAEKAKACFDRYNGVQRPMSRLDDFRKSDCAQRNGGNCRSTAIPGNLFGVACSREAGEGPDQGTPRSESSASEDDQTDPALAAASTCNRSGCDLIRNYVNPIIVLLSYLVGIAVVIGIIVGGIQVASSAGDPQKSASGKKHIQNALIGLVGYVILFAFLQFLIPGGVV